MPAGTLRRSDSIGILVRFGLLALVPIIALGVVLARELSTDVQQRYLDSASSSATLIAQVGIQPLLLPEDLVAGLTPERVAEVDARLQGAAVSSDVTRIKVWSRDGVVVYSDNHALIGRRFAIDGDLAASLAGRSSSNITDGHDEENSGDDLQGPLVQVYVPLVFSGNSSPSGAFELYLPYAPVQAAINRESNQLYAVLGAGLALVYASLFPIVLVADRWRRRLTAANAQAEADRHARDEAQRLNEMKSRFLASMSHELRTPLNSILGFAQLLKLHVHGSLAARQLRYVDNIESSGRHLLALINDVLDLSKIEAGKLEVADQPVPLDQVLNAAVDVVQPLAEQKRIRMGVSGDRSLRVQGDDRRLTQVVVNLLSNSVKFTPAEGRIEVRVAPSNGSLASIEVQDSGSGIAADDQSAIFEDFVQARTGRGRAHEGTGLGLAISLRLMRLMKGDLHLVSSSPAGTVFRITIPVAHVA